MPKTLRRALVIAAITIASQLDKCGGGCGAEPGRLFPTGPTGPLVAAR